MNGFAATVAVCTMARRRPYLSKCLEALVRAGDPARIEILVVCRPEDELHDLLRVSAERLPVRRVASGREALSAKRNAAVRAARGVFLAFLDDDAMPTPGYMDALRDLSGRDRECYAGVVEPVFEGSVPESLRGAEFHIGGFNRLGDTERRDRFVGANCAFLTAALRSAPPFDLRIGAGAPYLPWGEDTLMFEFFQRRSTAAFADRLVVRHHIQADRLNRAYVLRRAWLNGRTRAFIEREVFPDYGRRALSVAVMAGLAIAGRSRRPSDLGRAVRAAQLRGYLYEAAKGCLTGVPPRARPS